ncbi:MAG: DUF58 domain-containing protein [Candidatus Paceibacterota bacterium]
MTNVLSFYNAAHLIAVKGSPRYLSSSISKNTYGSGEFDHLSEYVYGESFKRVHAGASARSGRYYVKKCLDDQGKRSLVILDPSSSMLYGSTVSKWSTSLGIAEVIMLSLTQNGESTRFIVPNSIDSGYIKNALIAQVIRDLTPPSLCDSESLEFFFSNSIDVTAYSSIVFITDLFSVSEKLLSFAKKCSWYNSLTIIRVIDPLETEIPVSRRKLIFKDPESGIVVRCSINEEVKDLYAFRQQQYLSKCSDILTAAKVDVVDICNNEEFMHDLVRKLYSRRMYDKS